LVIETYVDTSTDAVLNSIFEYVDMILTISFTLEAVMKILRNGFFVSPTSYLSESWSVLDFIIVTTSLIDIAVSSINLPILKILRLLRTLRPLRFISQNPNMKILVNGLLESLVAILNVLIVICMVWVMFAILGTNLMGQKFGACSVKNDPEFNFYGVNKKNCTESYNGTWVNYQANFDDILQGMVTLFAVSTLEGWPDNMAKAMDANDAEYGPEYNSNIVGGIYFVVFVLVSSIILMNLVVGVIAVQFKEEQRKEIQSKFYMVTEDQMRWLQVQELIQSAKPNFDIMIRPKGKIRIFFFKLIQSKPFELSIMGCIIGNIIIMAMNYDGMTDEYAEILDGINLAFTVVFIVELILKLVALDFQYFTSSWNNFDFSIVMLSIIDIVLSNIGNSISFLKVGPQFARVLRVLRVSRLFKLMKAKQLQGINKIFKTLIFSLPSLLNVLVLMMLIYFIFAVLAVFLFKDYPVDDPVRFQNQYYNFNSFHNAFLTLFVLSTGENWPSFMYQYGKSGTDRLVSQAFFLFFIFLTSIVMINVFQLVVMQQFDEFYFNSDNAVNSFDEMSENFRITWNLFTIKTRGTKIKESRITEFFYFLE
jgi:hypothetical protein